MPIVVFILYFPNLKVFIYQFFGKGGLGGADGWLGKPDNYFFFDYLHYCFNNSYFIIGLIMLIFILSIILNFKNFKFSKFQAISLAWFLLHFFIAFFYSIFKNPILQYSILIFSFPFLLIFIFSFLPEIKIKLKIAAVLIILIFGIFNTVISNRFYNTNHFADFKSIANTIISLDDKYGYNNITRTINCNGPYYIDYYFLKKNQKVSFVKYQNVGGEDYLKLKKILTSSKTNYFLNAVTQLDPPEVEDIIMTQYPYIIEDYNFSISSVTLYSKIKPLKPIARKLPCKIIFNGFENKNDFWSNDTLHLSSEKVKDGKYSFKFDSLVEYGPTFRENRKEFQDNKNIKSYKISLDVYSDNEINNAILVFQITSNDKVYEWRGASLHNFFEKGKWNKVFLNWILPDIKPNDYVVSIYVWNPKKENFYTDNFEIKLFTEKLW